MNEYFKLSAEEYGQALTIQHQRTLYYLVVNEYITPEEYHALLETTFVVPVRNTPSLTSRFLSRFFNKKSGADAYVFPIVDVSDDPSFTPALNEKENTSGKPNLTVVTNSRKPNVDPSSLG